MVLRGISLTWHGLSVLLLILKSTLDFDVHMLLRLLWSSSPSGRHAGQDHLALGPVTSKITDGCWTRSSTAQDPAAHGARPGDPPLRVGVYRLKPRPEEARFGDYRLRPGSPYGPVSATLL